MKKKDPSTEKERAARTAPPGARELDREDPGSLPLPQGLLVEAFEAALKPFGDVPLTPVDSFNIQSSGMALELRAFSPGLSALFVVRSTGSFGRLLSQGTRLDGRPLLGSGEAFEQFVRRFLREWKGSAAGREDWVLAPSLPSAWPGKEATQVLRILAGLSLVEIRFWAGT